MQPHRELVLGEQDVLTGGADADLFVLGDNRHFYYVGRGEQDYATITDFTPSVQPTPVTGFNCAGGIKTIAWR
jgi:hypothetical protein